jgi:Ca2+-binding RTX toxin-like protein
MSFVTPASTAPSTQARSRNRQSSNSSDSSVLNPAAFQGSVANLPVGSSSTATSLADFNGDGQLDLVVTLASAAISNNLLVFLGSGNGSFGPALSLTTDGLSPVAVETGDFDRDGNLDLVTANFGSDTVSLLLGTGTGSFLPAQTFRVGSQPNALTLGDFNKDGQLDLVTADAGGTTNHLSLLLGEGNGSFRSATTLKVKGTQPFAVTSGDFDRDGNLDLVSADTVSESISLLRGRGNGTFADAKQFFVGNASPVAIVTGDFDGDNKLDVATGNLGGNGRDITVFFGDGKGDFPEALVLSAGGNVNSLVAEDLNGDGHLDLAATLLNSTTLSVLWGDGDGAFTRTRSTAINNSPNGLSVGDLNGDGKPDFVSASGGTTNASVTLNETSFVVLRSTKQQGVIDGSQETDASITVDLERGRLTVNSRPAIRVAVEEFDDVLGTSLKDEIRGNDARNQLTGNLGPDTLTGLSGNDTLIGGEGRDRLDGGAGNDRLSGGTGSDWLKAGEGRDRFIFDHGAPFTATSQDRIVDFEKGQDKIVLDRSTFTALRGKVSFASVQTIAQAGGSMALITYIRSTGRLYYNADGAIAGFGSGGWFAKLDQSGSANGALAAADFLTQR